jgi:anti-sigma regulatory factor (Ser/Thr protein kinase)
MGVRTTMDGTDQPAAASPLSISITAAHELADARATLRDWLRASIPVGQADEILLASGEALSNALEHGRTPITLRLEWVDNTLHLTVRDSGSWRPDPWPRDPDHDGADGQPDVRDHRWHHRDAEPPVRVLINQPDQPDRHPPRK